MNSHNDIFHPLGSEIRPPESMNNPFSYEPHPLCVAAAQEVRAMVAQREEWRHEVAQGKMFGVLVVEKSDESSGVQIGRVGYLAAYSGQLVGRSDWPGFVPAVFDYLQADGYFKLHERRIDALTAEIEQMKASGELKALQDELLALKNESEKAIAQQQKEMAAARMLRQRRRKEALLSERDKAEMIGESQFQKAELHRLKVRYRQLIGGKQALLDDLLAAIGEKEQRRKDMSVELQQWLFSQFIMTNHRDEHCSLLEIFADATHSIPPSGSGECCEPKLLQYAYSHGMRPLGIAMFWMGQSPQGEVRHDGHYYPACSGKCGPILRWMLPQEVLASGAERSFTASDLPVIYDDDDFMVVDKPSGLLSVPGKTAAPSVIDLLEESFTNGQKPLSVHRLDQATSGLLIVAKHPKAQRELQSMFASRKVEKRYRAVLDGLLAAHTPHEGIISLPLRPDIDDRPRQMADLTHGRRAVTRYKVVEEINGKTLIELRPETGRTHQLRVHCAHKSGLGVSIVGDNLYGKRAARLMLHAYFLKFKHPISNLLIELKSPFDIRLE